MSYVNQDSEALEHNKLGVWPRHKELGINFISRAITFLIFKKSEKLVDYIKREASLCSNILPNDSVPPHPPTPQNCSYPSNREE